jgi:hypothetical protein
MIIESSPSHVFQPIAKLARSRLADVMVDMWLSLIETRREPGDRPSGTRGFLSTIYFIRMEKCF